MAISLAPWELLAGKITKKPATSQGWGYDIFRIERPASYKDLEVGMIFTYRFKNGDLKEWEEWELVRRDNEQPYVFHCRQLLGLPRSGKLGDIHRFCFAGVGLPSIGSQEDDFEFKKYLSGEEKERAYRHLIRTCAVKLPSLSKK